MLVHFSLPLYYLGEGSKAALVAIACMGNLNFAILLVFFSVRAFYEEMTELFSCDKKSAQTSEVCIFGQSK
jgi:hypothetical protein